MSTLRVLGTASILSLLAPAARVDELAFAPAAGTTLQRTCTSSFALELTELSVQFNGEDLPAEYLGDAEGNLSSEERWVVTDVLARVADGRPLELVRTFDELSGRDIMAMGDGEGPAEPEESLSTSALEGKSVVFTWNAEEERHEAAWAEGEEGDEALLEGLEEDMDLRFLLPGRALEAGESWELDVQLFDDLTGLGGDFGLTSEDDEEDSDETEEALRENAEGTFAAEYVGVKSEDGRRIAVIRLKAESRSFADEPMTGTDMPEGFAGSRRNEVAIEMEGELAWDLEHGHALTLELDGTLSMKMAQTVRGEMEGESFEQAQTMLFEGPTSFRLAIERQ